MLPRRAPVLTEALIAEEARRNLPIGVYLYLMDCAARTGSMPILTIEGKPTGQFQELNPVQRMTAVQFLINKILPDVPKEVYHLVQAPREAESMPIDRLPTASTETLRAIANGAHITDVAFTAHPTSG